MMPLFTKGKKFSLMQCPQNEWGRKQMERIPYASAVGSLMYAQTWKEFLLLLMNNCVLYSCGHICYSWNLIKDHLFHYAAVPWPQIRQLGLLCIIFTHHANQTYYRKFQSDSRERARRLAVSVLVILSHCSTWVCDRWNLQICFHWNRENSRLLSMYKRHYLVLILNS